MYSYIHIHIYRSSHTYILTDFDAFFFFFFFFVFLIKQVLYVHALRALKIEKRLKILNAFDVAPIKSILSRRTSILMFSDS